jgi:hypothetical protein
MLGHMLGQRMQGVRYNPVAAGDVDRQSGRRRQGASLTEGWRWRKMSVNFLSQPVGEQRWTGRSLAR